MKNVTALFELRVRWINYLKLPTDARSHTMGFPCREQNTATSRPQVEPLPLVSQMTMKPGRTLAKPSSLGRIKSIWIRQIDSPFLKLTIVFHVTLFVPFSSHIKGSFRNQPLPKSMHPEFLTISAQIVFSSRYGEMIEIHKTLFAERDDGLSGPRYQYCDGKSVFERMAW